MARWLYRVADRFVRILWDIRRDNTNLRITMLTLAYIAQGVELDEEEEEGQAA